MSTITEEDLFNLSDEELEKVYTPSLEQSSEEPEKEASEEKVEETNEEPEKTEEPVVETPSEESVPEEESVPQEPTTEPEVEAPPADEKQEGVEDEPSIEELKAFYTALNTPFKAGGGELKIRSAEEAIRLMQQGIGYTKRMQALAPQRKLIMMLEQHGLSDPNKLSYLIDIHNRNPEAIKKLLIDSKIDPMEIDTNEVPAYQASNHQVSDKDFAFKTQLEEILSSDYGNETLAILDKWDQASQNALYENPSDMHVIREHVQNGFYNQVDSEITRHKSLGNIPLSTPYIQAYRVVAEELLRVQQQEQAAPTIPTTSTQQTVAPVVVRTAPVSTPATKGNPSAATPPRQMNTTKRQLTAEDIMNMSDEELAKLPPSIKW